MLHKTTTVGLSDRDTVILHIGSLFCVRMTIYNSENHQY